MWLHFDGFHCTFFGFIGFSCAHSQAIMSCWHKYLGWSFPPMHIFWCAVLHMDACWYTFVSVTSHFQHATHVGGISSAAPLFLLFLFIFSFSFHKMGFAPLPWGWPNRGLAFLCYTAWFVVTPGSMLSVPFLLFIGTQSQISHHQSTPCSGALLNARHSFVFPCLFCVNSQVLILYDFVMPGIWLK